MLYAFKSELHARVAREVVSVRERELSYYNNNLRVIGFSAALLSGFAFSTLAAHRTINVIRWLEPFSSAYENRTTLTPFILVTQFTLTSSQSIQVALEIAYLSSTIAAMGLCIYTLYICLLLSITGPGLALRGPEGSVDKAVILLARGCRKVIQAFALALNLFITSVILQGFLTFHLYASFLCLALLSYYMYIIQRHSSGIVRMFRIDPLQVVTGRFEVERSTGMSNALTNYNIFPTPLDLAREVGGFLRRRRRVDRAPSAAQSPDAPQKHMPSEITRDLFAVHQSPFPEQRRRGFGLFDDSELDAWFASTFSVEADGTPRQHERLGFSSRGANWRSAATREEPSDASSSSHSSSTRSFADAPKSASGAGAVEQAHARTGGAHPAHPLAAIGRLSKAGVPSHTLTVGSQAAAAKRTEPGGSEAGSEGKGLSCAWQQL